jgi:hypothetical protein
LAEEAFEILYTTSYATRTTKVIQKKRASRLAEPTSANKQCDNFRQKGAPKSVILIPDEALASLVTMAEEQAVPNQLLPLNIES